MSASSAPQRNRRFARTIRIAPRPARQADCRPGTGPAVAANVTSIISRDKTVVDRWSIRKIKHNLVDVAPAPALGRIVALNDRMMRGVKMLCCMLAGRLVATTDVPARAADFEVKPGIAFLQTFFAPQGARNDFANAVQMGARFGHDGSTRCCRVGPGEYARKPWIACTTCAPSPIALPTRLTDSDRTSPTANTPGTDDSQRRRAVALELRASDHKACVVHFHAATLQPFRCGIGPDEKEDVPNGRLRFSAGAIIAPADLFQASIGVPTQFDDLRLGHQLDVRRSPQCDRSGSATCSRQGRRRAPSCAPSRRGGKKYRGLTGGIAAADQDDLFSRA